MKPSPKQLTPDELARIRALRRLRVAAAKKAKVPIGWTDAQGNVVPGAPHLPDPPKDAA